MKKPVKKDKAAEGSQFLYLNEVARAKTLTMLDKMQVRVGGVVHTLEGKQPIRATRTEEGWDFETEEWVHSS